ncbi:hypothetical protein F4804DRAFT_193946 [Jackrogersella minutella]|nr:hypothetical protein F4804DRAFT_193946 [Jackrogersella minutella]
MIEASQLEAGGNDRVLLTYFLIEAVNLWEGIGSVDTGTQYQYLHIRRRFHAGWPQQVPVRYGGDNLSFFRIPRNILDTQCTLVHCHNKSRLVLGAHGVFEGDEYAVYPFNIVGSNMDMRSKVLPIVEMMMQAPEHYKGTSLGLGMIYKPLENLGSCYK